MDSRQPEDLGEGVRVVPLPDGGWQVRSPLQSLPWRARAGKVAGSTVMWNGLPWEVVAREEAGSGSRWRLRPWPETEAMRTVHHLDGGWISALSRDRASEKRSTRLRWGVLPILPLLGLVPGTLQNRWNLEWGFPSVAATALSALLELAIATVGVVHMLAAAFGNDGILPESIGWLGPLAPLLFLESVVRLKHAAGNQEPIGSVVGLPIAVFVHRQQHDDRPERPRTRLFDGEAGVLELQSAIHRRDWAPGGVLRYRDRLFELVKVERMGQDWLYRFAGMEANPGPSTLRLMPARSPLGARPDSRSAGGPGIVRVAVTTALSCMALRTDQERWAPVVGVSPALLTVLGAGSEIVGAMVNFETGQASGSAVAIIVNLYLVGEGLFRCAGLLTSGRPVGSVVGFALHPLMEKALRP